MSKRLYHLAIHGKLQLNPVFVKSLVQVKCPPAAWNTIPVLHRSIKQQLANPHKAPAAHIETIWDFFDPLHIDTKKAFDS